MGASKITCTTPVVCPYYAHSYYCDRLCQEIAKKVPCKYSLAVLAATAKEQS